MADLAAAHRRNETQALASIHRYQVYAVNPRAVDRYRDRHALAGAKSDGGDAKMLADLVRTDRHNHRQVAGDSDLAEAIKVTFCSAAERIGMRTRRTHLLTAPAIPVTLCNLRRTLCNHHRGKMGVGDIESRSDSRRGR